MKITLILYSSLEDNSIFKIEVNKFEMYSSVPAKW